MQKCFNCGNPLPEKVEGIYECPCPGKQDKAYFRESRNFGPKKWVRAGFWKTKEDTKEKERQRKKRQQQK